ncbi:MAG TPA: anti-sigma factor [Salinarimonas sp.]|jgi:anti-sigma-K factor RskA|nr:anti-sigma factor [Salinarimonas sp.]
MTRIDPELDRLAGEHVLGLLTGEEEARAEALIDEDDGFRRAVAYWRLRLGELDDLAEPHAPSDGLWSRIEADLGEAPARQAAEMAPVLVSDRAGALSALWRSLAFWRAAGLAGALALLLLAIGLPALWPSTERPVFVAVLMTEANQPAAVVNAFGDGRAELIPIHAVDVPRGRALEVWTVADPGQGPVSIGLLDRARTIRLNVGALRKPGADQFFAVSLEPEHGSPTGKPTGPVLMKGVASPTL